MSENNELLMGIGALFIFLGLFIATIWIRNNFKVLITKPVVRFWDKFSNIPMPSPQKLKYLKLITGIVIIILLATNPSRSDFASYLHITGTDFIGRDKNYFVCSVYSVKYQDKSIRFFGILGNFFKMD